MLAFLLVWFGMSSQNYWFSVDSHHFCIYEGRCYLNCIRELRNETQSGQWTTNDLNSVVNEIASKFSIDSSSLANYFNIVRYTNNAKRAFTTFGFEGTSYESRKIYLGKTLIKVTRSNGIYSISGQYVSSTGQAINGIPRNFCDWTYPNQPFNSIKINIFYEQMERFIHDRI